MSNWFRKFVAILMLLWLPLFSGSALAASVAMQWSGGSCNDVAMQSMSSDMDMPDMGMSEHQQHGELPSAADEQSASSCSACGVCHLACTGYLAVPGTELVTEDNSARVTIPYLVTFHSVSSAPLVPPPLARV